MHAKMNWTPPPLAPGEEGEWVSEMKTVRMEAQ